MQRVGEWLPLRKEHALCGHWIQPFQVTLPHGQPVVLRICEDCDHLRPLFS